MDILASHYFSLLFAGSWSLIWHWGVGVGLIVLCLLGAWFTTAIPIIGPYLTGARKDFLWAAFGIAVFLGGNLMGVHDEKAKCEAKSIVIEHVVEKAVEQATPRPAVKGKRQRARKPDPWDSKEN